MKTFIIAIIIFLALDMTWLGLVAKSYYRQQMGSLLRPKPNLPAAVLFYVIYIIGLMVFVITPALHDKSWHEALTKGALYGLATYGTYDLTNLSVIKNWPRALTALDLAWGVALSASVAVITTLIG